MSADIQSLIAKEADRLKAIRKRAQSQTTTRAKRESILSHDIESFLSYTWKPKKIWFPEWWPKAFDVNLWGDTPQRRIDQLVKAAALITLEIERLEQISMKQNYEIWVEPEQEGGDPVFIGQAWGYSFDDAVMRFRDLAGSSYSIQPEVYNNYSFRQDWIDRKSNWNINGRKLFSSKKDAHGRKD